jgi:hypothetical protein
MSETESNSLTREDDYREAMKMEPGGAACYICSEHIPEGSLDYGFTWGSDGFFPDGASAMYCCYGCRSFWIDPPEEEIK